MEMEKLKNFLKEENIKFTMVSTIVVYLMTHLVVFTNKFINEDDVYVFTTMQQSNVGSGRWFSGNVHYYISPWFIGIITSIAMAITIYMIVDIIRIREKKHIALVVLSIVTFPTLAYGFSYFFMAEVYSYSLCLSVLAVYVTKKIKHGYILGAVAMAFSLGYYQAYVAVTITLCLMIVLFEIISESESFKDILQKTLKYVVMGVLGFVLYFVFLELVLFATNAQLSDYRGVDSMGTLPLDKIGYLIKRTYKNFILFFLGERYFYNSIGKMIAYILIGSVSLALLFQYLKKLNRSSQIVGIISVIVMPLAIDVIDILAHETDTSTLTVFSFSLAFVCCIKLLEMETLDRKGILKNIVIASLGVVVFHNFMLTNIYYNQLESQTERTILYYNRLYARMEEVEGFHNEMCIVVLGNIENQKSALGIYNNEYKDIILNDQGFRDAIVGTTQDEFQSTTVKYKMLLNNIIGCNLTFGSSEFTNSFAERDEVKEMGVYPKDGGIKIVDNVMVVNMISEHILSDINYVNEDIIVNIDISSNQPKTSEEYTIAWYIYKDDEKVEEVWYEKNQQLIYTPKESGEYKVQYFVKNSLQDYVCVAFTETVTIEK